MDNLKLSAGLSVLGHIGILFLLMFCYPTLWSMDNAGAPMASYKVQRILSWHLLNKEWDPASHFSTTLAYRYNLKSKHFVFKGDLLSLDETDLPDIKHKNYIYEPEFKKTKTRLSDGKEVLVGAVFLGINGNNFDFSYTGR